MRTCGASPRRYNVATARRIAPGGFVTTGSKGNDGGCRLLPAEGRSAVGKPGGPYFGAVPPLPVVVVAGVLPRRTSRRS